eukprot:1027912_1
MAAAAGTTDVLLKELLTGIEAIKNLQKQWKAIKVKGTRTTAKTQKVATDRRNKAIKIKEKMNEVYATYLAPGKPMRKRIVGEIVKTYHSGTRGKGVGTSETREKGILAKPLSFLDPLDALKAKRWPFKEEEDMKPWTDLQAALSGTSEAQSGSYNELDLFDDSFDYQYHDRIGSGRSLPFDDLNRYQPLISEEYNDVSGSGSPLLIGGVVGASAVVIIMLIFCLGLAFGMVICWGCSQQRALDVKREKEEMHWIDDENRNEV